MIRLSCATAICFPVAIGPIDHGRRSSTGRGGGVPREYFIDGPQQI
jgi:hypothetical protein